MPKVRPSATGSARRGRSGPGARPVVTGLVLLAAAVGLAGCGLLEEELDDLLGDDAEPEPEAQVIEEEPDSDDDAAAAEPEEAAPDDEPAEPELDPAAWRPWAMPGGDASGSNRATLPAPERPGLDWWLDLGEVRTDFAPEGYDSVDRRILLSESGMLIARVSNPEEQYEETARFRSELIGVDLDSGEVQWEIPNISPVNSDRCGPALDERDRIWVEQRPGGGDRVVAAFDPETGEPLGPQIEAEDRRCRNQVLIGGDPERMVFSSGDPETLRMFDMTEEEPREINVDLATREDVDDLLNHGRRDHWAVMTDDHLVTLVEIVDEEGDTAEHRIVSISLEDGSTADEVTVPAADGADNTDYDRAYMIAHEDRIYLSTRSTGDSQVLAFDLLDGVLELDWSVDLEVRSRYLTLGDGMLLVQDGRFAAGSTPPITALALEDGSVVFDGGTSVRDQPLTNPDGTYLGVTQGEDSTRYRQVSRIGTDGQLVWQLPWSEVALALGEDPEEFDSRAVHLSGVDQQGRLLLVDEGGDGDIIALQRDGDLAVQEPHEDEDDG